MKRTSLVPGLALALAPAVAAAQAPYYPNPQAPSAPVSLDPAATGSQAPAPPPPPRASGDAKPSVVVVKPDGTISTAGAAPTEAPVLNYGGAAPDTGAPPAEDVDVAVQPGPTPELHVVRKGDTLWDICGLYFNDPWQWPKVWSYNPQISNPHWIYPGDLVRLLPKGVFASQPTTAEPEGGGAGAGSGATAGPEPKPDTVPPPAQRTEVGLKQTAFVEKSDLDRSITIDGTPDEKLLLGVGDGVYLSYPSGHPPQVGQRYSVYVPGNAVKTADGKEAGSYVRLLGTVEVQSVKQDKRARGVIVEANQEIERGAKVGPLVKTYKNVPPVAPSVDAQGAIVAMLTKDQLIGQGEVVFVDLGKSSGVQVGNRMFVVRRGDAFPKKASNTIGQDDRRFPARALGEIMVVEVGEKVSIGLVTLAVQEMGIGDLVMMQKTAQ